jgi:pimeloyl-ACP methyl ester carboxylesterase
VTYPRQDLKLITKSNVSKLESQKAGIILAILKILDIEKVNVVAHSEGAINTVIAARMTPLLFNDILLVGPGGLVENEGFLELASRFIGNLVQGGIRAFTDSMARKDLIRAEVETLKYFLMNPVMGLLEGSAISRTHLQDFLIDLHNNNISVGVIHGSGDIVFPLEKMKSLTDLPWIDLYSIDGDHSDIFTYPQKYVNILQRRFID